MAGKRQRKAKRSNHDRSRYADWQSRELVRSLRTALGLSQERLAQLLNVSVRTVARWESGLVEPDRELKKRLVLLERIVEQRMGVNEDPEAVISWLTSPQLFECNPLDLLSSSRGAQLLSVK
jgi:DNA-binding transcriptional regulator YiaG